jgi:hypothetical protein
MQRAYFSAGLGEFLRMRDEEVLGQMAQRTEYAVDLTQRDAWVEQLGILREGLMGVEGGKKAAGCRHAQFPVLHLPAAKGGPGKGTGPGKPAKRKGDGSPADVPPYWVFLSHGK